MSQRSGKLPFLGSEDEFFDHTGVASLGTAFLAAGASSVTVSLWHVADSSTAILMQEFYRNLLKGMPKAVSLAASRSTLVSQGYDNPFFWAPFVLTGE